VDDRDDGRAEPRRYMSPETLAKVGSEDGGLPVVEEPAFCSASKRATRSLIDWLSSTNCATWPSGPRSLLASGRSSPQPPNGAQRFSQLPP